MDVRLKVAMSAVLIAAMFVTAASGNWLPFLFFAATPGFRKVVTPLISTPGA